MPDGMALTGAISQYEGLTMDRATLAGGIGPWRRAIVTTWEIAPESGSERTFRRRKPHLTGTDLGASENAEKESRDIRPARRPKARRST
jgi:hypothetical protein